MGSSETSRQDDLLTSGEAARILGVWPTTVHDYVERGLLACRRLPSGHRRFRRADVEKLVKAKAAL